MIQRTIPISFQHRVSFTHGAFDAKNHTLRDLVADSCELGEQSKVLVLLDSGVAEANPGLTDKIFRYFTVHTDTLNLVTEPMTLQGGEPCKNDWSLVEKIWQAVEFHKICLDHKEEWEMVYCEMVKCIHIDISRQMNPYMTRVLLF